MVCGSLLYLRFGFVFLFDISVASYSIFIQVFRILTNPLPSHFVPYPLCLSDSVRVAIFIKPVILCFSTFAMDTHNHYLRPRIVDVM